MPDLNDTALTQIRLMDAYNAILQLDASGDPLMISVKDALDALMKLKGKSADEMFREMGYKRVASPSMTIVYEKDEEEAPVRIIVYADNFYTECLICEEESGLLKDEILAVAQLIREKEAHQDAENLY